MKVHEKAKLYDSLLRDYEELIIELKQHSESIKEIPNRSDLIEMKESNISSYYPLLAGTYQGSNFGLEMKISRNESNLNWYKNQK
jgi:hypothetical protein